MDFIVRYPVKRRVIVNLKTGRAFRGILWQRRRGYLVLRQAEMLQPAGGTTPVDGEVVVERANVDFVQVL